MEGTALPALLIGIVLGAVIAPVMTVRYLARSGRGAGKPRHRDRDPS